MRKYGSYPSVTSVISEMYTSKNVFLHNWLKNPDNQIKVQESAKFGTDIHFIAQSYLQGIDLNPVYGTEKYRIFETFVKPLCDSIKDDLLFFEKPLTSSSFMIGGTPDFFCKSGLLIDLKTSAKRKHLSSLEGYKMQLGAYSALVKENYPDIKINFGVLHIVVLNLEEIQSICLNSAELLDYFKKFMFYRSEFYKQFNY